jgi:hypothetical protein
MSTEAQIQRERDKWCTEMPQSFRAAYRKAMDTKSLRAAVNAKCQDCMNWQRVEIRDCLVVICPLWPHRPYQKARKRSNRGILAKRTPGPISDDFNYWNYGK